MELMAIYYQAMATWTLLRTKFRRRFRRVEANDLQEVEQCLDDLVPVLASTPK